MKKNNRRTLLPVVGLILLTAAAMGIAGHRNTGGKRDHAGQTSGGLVVSAALVQDKVLLGADGLASLALTIQAPEADLPGAGEPPAVELVVVLDRSGSMQGRKIEDARRAVGQLVETLSSGDRLALVSYSNSPERLSGLLPMTAHHRRNLTAAIEGVQAGGGTNLGGGLEAGLALFAEAPMGDRHRKLILISDGLANQGITAPADLGQMAATGLARDWTVSTVGVGSDFNEHLMTTLADRGGGTYTYLEDPAAIAAVFQQEYRHMLAAAASGMTISMPEHDGLRLIDAGGYPIERRAGRVFFHPGNIRFGQSRTFYLTFKVPTAVTGEVGIEGLQVAYRSRDGRVTTTLGETFTIACVASRRDVMASIRKEPWAGKVLQEDFGRLKDAVADAIRDGDEQQALKRIDAYRREKAAVNQVVASPRVAENLAGEVHALGELVRETFACRPEALPSKQKQNAKSLQYESYRIRRDNP